MTARGKKQIPGLDVAMGDALRVKITERLGALSPQLLKQRQRHPALGGQQVCGGERDKRGIRQRCRGVQQRGRIVQRRTAHLRRDTDQGHEDIRDGIGATGEREHPRAQNLGDMGMRHVQKRRRHIAETLPQEVRILPLSEKKLERETLAAGHVTHRINLAHAAAPQPGKHGPLTHPLAGGKRP